MSVLQVSNIHLESTGNNRIQYTGSNSLIVTVAGSNALSVNTTGTHFSGTINATSYTIGSNVSINSSAFFIGNSTVNTSISNGNLTINGNNVSPVQSFRNKIINGNFDFWQRGTSVTGVSAGQYVADRWIHYRAGTTGNASRQAFTLGQTNVPGEPTYFHRVATSSVANSSNYYLLQQHIESVRTLAGQTATLSFWAKADASKNMAVEFVQVFGTGGSPSSVVNTIGVTTCALTTSWQKFTITVNIPSISGKTLGSDNNDSLALLFWLDAGSNFNSRTNSLGQQSGTFDIAQVQLEAGPVATPFEMRPMGTELALCQRYYEKSFPLETAPAQAAGYLGAVAFPCLGNSTYSQHWINYKVPKRGTPTVTTYNPVSSNALIRNSDGAVDYVNTTTDQGSIFGCRLAGASSGSGNGLGHASWVHYTASAEL